MLWTWPSIVVQNNNNTSGSETKFFWSFFTSLRVLRRDVPEKLQENRKTFCSRVTGNFSIFERVYSSLKAVVKNMSIFNSTFNHLEASALLVLLWCFGHKLILNSSDRSLTFTYRSHALACLFCGCRFPEYRCMNAKDSIPLQCLKGQFTQNSVAIYSS